MDSADMVWLRMAEKVIRKVGNEDDLRWGIEDV